MRRAVRLAAAAMVEAEWADVWSEYRRSTFDRLGLDERRARAVVERTVAVAVAARTRPDPDRVAEALKEFILREEDLHFRTGNPSRRETADLVACLRRAGGLCRPGERGGRPDCAPILMDDLLTQHDYAVRKFGTAAEDLGLAVLAHLAELVSS